MHPKSPPTVWVDASETDDPDLVLEAVRRALSPEYNVEALLPEKYAEAETIVGHAVEDSSDGTAVIEWTGPVDDRVSGAGQLVTDPDGRVVGTSGDVGDHTIEVEGPVLRREEMGPPPAVREALRGVVKKAAERHSFDVPLHGEEDGGE